MLDYTKRLTSEEIWQDCLAERLTDILMHLKEDMYLTEQGSPDFTPLNPRIRYAQDMKPLGC
jgi:hypothetical protein